MRAGEQDAPFSRMGHWWLPENPEHRLAGTLTLSKRGKPTLELLGSLNKSNSLHALFSEGSPGFSPSVVFGVTGSGTRYTLQDCRESIPSINCSTGRAATSRITGRRLIEGTHIPSPDAETFRYFRVRMTYLESWRQEEGKALSCDPATMQTTGIIMTYVPPKSLNIQLPKGRLVMGHEWQSYHAAHEDFRLSENIALGCWPDTPITLTQFRSVWFPPIHLFFTLGTGTQVELISLEARTVAACAGKSDEEMENIPCVRIYPPPHERPETPETLSEWGMIFASSDVRDRLEEHLGRWDGLYRKIGAVMHLFFGHVLAPESYSVLPFQCATQAAEAYHRHRCPEPLLPTKEHRALLKTLRGHIPKDTPKEYRESLLGRMGYANEKTQRQRLRELLEEREDLFELSKDDVKTLVKQIVDMRNFFTHYSGNKRLDDFDLVEFYRYPVLLKWAVVACLLEEMGMNRETAHRLINRNESFRFFRSNHLKPQLIDLRDGSNALEKLQADERKETR